MSNLISPTGVERNKRKEGREGGSRRKGWKRNLTITRILRTPPPPPPPTLATRIELIHGAKLNTRILIITGGRRSHENSRHAKASSTLFHLSPFAALFTSRKIFLSPSYDEWIIVNEYAQVKSPFRTIGPRGKRKWNFCSGDGGVTRVGMMGWPPRRKFCVKSLSAGESLRQSFIWRVESRRWRCNGNIPLDRGICACVHEDDLFLGSVVVVRPNLGGIFAGHRSHVNV